MDKKNRTLAFSMLMLVAGMAMLSYASVPLYRMFCQITGFGGTTQEGKPLPTKVLDREIIVSFNADIDPNLPWRFRPLQMSRKVKVGEQVLIAYEAENLSDKATSGTAAYNVTPHEFGAYFNKIQCFCFSKQTLPPKTVVNMPVSFFIDPEIVNDHDLDDVKQVTLSYTFFSELSKN